MKKILLCIIFLSQQLSLALINPQPGENLHNLTQRIGTAIDEDFAGTFTCLSSMKTTLTTINENVCLIDNNLETLIKNQGFVSTFGDSIVASREDMINIQFSYGFSNFNITTSVVSTGTVTAGNSLMILASGIASNGYARAESIRKLRYRPGHEGYAFFTAIFTNGSTANSTQLIGLFDVADGFAVGYNGNEFSVLHRNNSVDTFVAQSNFNRDTIDGTGPSGFNIDTAKINVFRIAYGWLGAAAIKFQVMSNTGEWITFHVIERPNSFVYPSVLNPFLPIRVEVDNNGDTGNVGLATASWNAGMVGIPNSAGHRYFSEISNLITLPASGEQFLLAIRNKSIFHSFVNEIETRITAFSGGTVSATKEFVLFRVYINPTITGASFSDVNANSINEVTDVGSITGGVHVFTFMSTADGNGPILQFLPRNEFPLILFPGQILAITGESLSGGGNDAIISLTWEERF